MGTGSSLVWPCILILWLLGSHSNPSHVHFSSANREVLTKKKKLLRGVSTPGSKETKSKQKVLEQRHIPGGAETQSRLCFPTCGLSVVSFVEGFAGVGHRLAFATRFQYQWYTNLTALKEDMLKLLICQSERLQMERMRWCERLYLAGKAQLPFGTLLSDSVSSH